MGCDGNAGVPAVVVQDIVGHASEAVSQVYTKIETDTKRKAMETTRARMESTT